MNLVTGSPRVYPGGRTIRQGIFVYPTDTAYALGCVYTDQTAVRKIMQIKGRKDTKFTLIASSLHQVEQHFTLSTAQRRLAKKYWPGPLSIVVSKKYAVRVPKQPIARALAKKLGAPLLATSLNISGRPTIYDLHNVETILGLSLQKNNVSIIDIGKLPKTPPSTIVECVGEKIIIQRAGPIKIKA